MSIPVSFATVNKGCREMEERRQEDRPYSRVVRGVRGRDVFGPSLPHSTSGRMGDESLRHAPSIHARSRRNT